MLYDPHNNNIRLSITEKQGVQIKMELLQKQIIELLKEEHQDWVQHLKEAEESGEGIDVNLGGNFASRLEKLLTSFREFENRHKPNNKKKGIFG